MENPVKYFSNVPAIIDLIFQHFDAKDLLHLSTISKASNTLVFKTDCIEKITLRVDRINAAELLKDSKCQSSEQSLFHPLSDYSKIKLMMPIENVRIAEILEEVPLLSSLEIEGSFLVMDLLRQIESFCQGVEELKLCRHSDLRTNYEALTIDWEENQDIEWALIKSEFYEFAFANVRTLSIANVGHVVAYEIIKRCPMLSNLTLMKTRGVEKLFVKMATEGSQKLKQLSVSEHSFYTFNQQKPELRELLYFNLSSLEVLKLDMWAGLPSLKLIFEMPKLKHLELFELSKCDSSIIWDCVELPINLTITRLSLQDLNSNLQLLQRLLLACPKLKALKLYELNQEAFCVILSNARKLDELKAEFVSGDLQSVYDYLQ